MKNVRFSSRQGAKVRCQGPPGAARAQPCFKEMSIENHSGKLTMDFNVCYMFNNVMKLLSARFTQIIYIIVIIIIAQNSNSNNEVVVSRCIN